MRKFLLPLLALVVANCKAQQTKIDSLQNELDKHPQQDTARLNVLNAITYQYSMVNALQGLAIGKEALVLAKRINDKHKLATAMLNYGINLNTLGNDSTALNFYNNTLNLSKQLKDESLSAAALHNIGIIYYEKSDYTNALKYQEASLSIYKKLSDEINAGNTLSSIGIIYQSMSDYSTALNYQQQALYFFEKVNNVKGIISAYTNMGIVYSNLRQLDKALDYHQKALTLSKQRNDKIAMINALNNMGGVYDNMNDSARTINSYTRALDMSWQAKYQFGISSSTSNLGFFYFYRGDFEKAYNYLSKSIIYFKQSGNKNDLSQVLNVMGEIYTYAAADVLKKAGIEEKDRYKAAHQLQDSALNLGEQIRSYKRRVYTLVSISDLYEQEKNYKQALYTYKEASDLNDSMITDTKLQDITRLEMQFQFTKTRDSIQAVTDKEQVLAAAKIQKQKVVNNSLLAGAGFLLIAGFSGFALYKHNRDVTTQKNEAELKAQVSDTEMKALRAQMNPHFIFNSLNSIADYIAKNETSTATEFTSKFARLMRVVLENSEQKAIPLADDLKALELYMQLECFRLKNKFTYTINVAKNIDKENTLIPPLILQPFVENSIWHGVAKKEGQGHINIFIEQQDEMINCIVEDDGAGIKPAITATEEKKSLGMKITNARIDLLNRIKNANASIKVTSQQQGVRAEVKLPLELAF